MEQLTIFSKDQEVKSLLEELEDCTEYSGRCRIIIDKIAALIGAEFNGDDLIYKGTNKSVDMYRVHQNVGFLPKTSMKYRLNAKGIETVCDGKDTYLVYDGNKIPRPNVSNCVATVKRIFNVDI